MEIFRTSKFERQYKKLPEAVQVVAEKKEKIFRKNPFEASLKTHRLKGNLKNYWSFSVNYSYRILFRFGSDKKTVYFMSIGDHQVYR